MDKVVFLDRDGTINRAAGPHQYVVSWEDFRLLPRVPEAIRLLNEAGYRVIVVSNQRCIARGLATARHVDALHQRLNAELGKKGAHVDAFYYCPHEEGECGCRKPGIGLFLRAEYRYHVDKARSYMVGDSPSDMEAGRRYGVSTIFLGEGRDGDAQCGSLFEAAQRITGGHAR